MDMERAKGRQLTTAQTLTRQKTRRAGHAEHRWNMKIMNKTKIILASIFVPPGTLAIIVLASEVAEKNGIKLLSEKIHEMLNMLTFWPMYIYEFVIPEPIGGWEGFDNDNVGKFIIAALVAYSFIIFAILYWRLRRSSNTPLEPIR
ncbi:MAG: hypothetical protein JJE30_10085 [Desulfuromonadales bacterium]|nr:hypothetical protein [Desulfuromonadales bacterium]